MTQKEKGILGEQVAMRYALGHGMKFLESNYHSPYGEIDLICKDDKDTLVFIEVKMRNERSMVGGLEAVGVRKRSRIVKTACDYMQKKSIEMSTRFDVMEVKCNNKTRPTRINYIKNAFGLEGLGEIF
jgi:TIGR00252 family protein